MQWLTLLPDRKRLWVQFRAKVYIMHPTLKRKESLLYFPVICRVNRNKGYVWLKICANEEIWNYSDRGFVLMTDLQLFAEHFDKSREHKQDAYSCGRSLLCSRCQCSYSGRRSTTECTSHRVHSDLASTWEIDRDRQRQSVRKERLISESFSRRNLEPAALQTAPASRCLGENPDWEHI